MLASAIQTSKKDHRHAIIHLGYRILVASGRQPLIIRKVMYLATMPTLNVYNIAGNILGKYGMLPDVKFTKSFFTQLRITFNQYGQDLNSTSYIY